MLLEPTVLRTPSQACYALRHRVHVSEAAHSESRVRCVIFNLTLATRLVSLNRPCPTSDRRLRPLVHKTQTIAIESERTLLGTTSLQTRLQSLGFSPSMYCQAPCKLGSSSTEPEMQVMLVLATLSSGGLH